MKRSILLKAMVAMYGLSALAGVVTILSDGRLLVPEVLFTMLTVSGVLTVTLLCRLLAVVGNRRIRYLMDLGWIASACAGVCAIIGLWLSGSPELMAALVRIGMGSFILCLAIMHIGFIFYWRSLEPVFSVVRWLVFAINLFFLSQLELGFISEDLLEEFIDLFGGDIYGRSIAALVIIFSCGTVAIPLGYLITRTHQHHADQAGLSSRIAIPVNCPRCGFDCELHVGHSTCPQCKLCFTLKVDEPRCRCGYLLYRVEADDCPECGRSIPDHVRWKTLDRSPEPST